MSLVQITDQEIQGRSFLLSSMVILIQAWRSFTIRLKWCPAKVPHPENLITMRAYLSTTHRIADIAMTLRPMMHIRAFFRPEKIKGRGSRYLRLLRLYCSGVFSGGNNKLLFLSVLSRRWPVGPPVILEWEVQPLN